MNLKVLTFNIHNGINRHGKYNMGQIADFIRLIKPDLAGLQEVSRFWSLKTNYQDMVSFLTEQLEMYHAFAPTLNRRCQSFFGNLILSKYPLINTWSEILPGNHEPRNYLAVQVQAGGARVNFLTTHLGLSDSERLVQINRIVGFGVQLGDPLVVTGDFNQGPDGPGMALLKSNWHKHDPTPRRGTIRLSNGQLGPEIDLIFSSPNLILKSLKVYENELSDHLPVCGEFEMEVAWNQAAGQQVYIM